MMDSDVKKFNVTLEDTTYEKVALLVTYIGEYITTNDIQAIMSLPKEEKIALCDGWGDIIEECTIGDIESLNEYKL